MSAPVRGSGIQVASSAPADLVQDMMSVRYLTARLAQQVDNTRRPCLL